MANKGKTGLAGTELKVNIDKLKLNIEDMNGLCVSMVNYTPELNITNSKGASVDSMITIYEQFLRMQEELSALYLNTAYALQMTSDTFNKVDNALSNYFKELDV